MASSNDFKIKMELEFDEETAFVQPNEAPLDEPLMCSKTASKRTLEKYLKRKMSMNQKCNEDHLITFVNPSPVYDRYDSPVKLYGDCTNEYDAMDEDECNTDENTSSGNSTDKLSENQIDFTMKELSPITKSFSSFNNTFKLQNSNCNNNVPKLNNNLLFNDTSSVNRLLKFVLENKPMPMTQQNLAASSNLSYMLSKLPPLIEPDSISSSLSESIDKQEKEIAYNLLLRKLIDECLDRNVIYSRQPKDVLCKISALLTRQFHEYDQNRHPSKIRSYLKACRRNSKKNNGKIIMKNTGAYLSSGPGHRLMSKMCMVEHDNIELIKMEALQHRNKSERSANNNLNASTTSSLLSGPPHLDISNQHRLLLQQSPLASTNPNLSLQASNALIIQSNTNKQNGSSLLVNQRDSNSIAKLPKLSITKLPILMAVSTSSLSSSSSVMLGNVNSMSCITNPIVTNGYLSPDKSNITSQLGINSNLPSTKDLNRNLANCLQQINIPNNSTRDLINQLYQCSNLLNNLAALLESNCS